MLLWQRIGWPKRYTFLSKLFFFSALGHGALLFFILFFYKGDNFSYALNLDTQDMTVLFLPFQKTITTAQVAGGAKSGSSRLKVINSPKRQKNKKVKTKNKNGQNKNIPDAPTALADAELKKGKNKKTDAAKKSEEPKKEEKKEEQVAQLEQPVPQEIPKPLEVLDLSEEETVYVGQQDLNALELRQELLQEIEQAWRPPVGLTTGKVCKVRVLVDWQGKIEDIIFEESSQVVAFDASVRHALLTMNFPKSSYGKELILPFH